jgi:hypothetical protein
MFTMSEHANRQKFLAAVAQQHWRRAAHALRIMCLANATKRKHYRMIYAGIGSRETPQATLDLMNLIGFTLAQKGHSLRSGGAKGADSAFEAGASNGGAYAMNKTH